jgi:hypothetical protein
VGQAVGFVMVKGMVVQLEWLEKKGRIWEERHGELNGMPRRVRRGGRQRGSDGARRGKGMRELPPCWGQEGGGIRSGCG